VVVGDLVKFRSNQRTGKNFTDEIGLIVEVQARGPVPGAYVLWSSMDKTEWVKIENLKIAEKCISQ